MNRTSPSLRKRLSTLLIALLTVQPALAQTMQYRIPLNGASYQQPLPTPNPGTGAGDVDTGENPVEPLPNLTVRPSVLQFEAIPGVPARPLKALVLNTGNVPTKVTGITANENFDVTHSCAGTLPVGASCQISAAPSAKAPSAVTYNMAVTAPGTAAPATLTLETYERPTEGPAPQLSLSDSLVNMGTLKPGQRMNVSAQLTNVGTAAALLGGISSGAGFTVTDDCPDTLGVGATCTISANFASYEAQIHSHTMGLTSGRAGRTEALTFYAEVQKDPALLPALELDQSFLSFGPLDAGAAETKKAVLTNRGTAPALLSGITATAPFSVTSACPAQLEVGASCDIIVTFNAFTQGTAPAQVMTIKAQNGVTRPLLLNGGVNGGDSQAPNLVFAPNDLDFGDLSVGQSATLETVVKNDGVSDAKVSDIKVDFGAANFSQTNNCTATLAPGATCRVNVTFKATQAASRSGRLLISLSNGPSGALALSGRGQQALLAAGPMDVDFGAVALPGTSAVRTVSLSNSGNVPLTGLAVSNNNPRMTIAYGSCTETLEAKKGCSLSLTYAPGATGPFNGQFTVSSANGGSAVVKWHGSAVKLAVGPSSLTFPETLLGTSAPDQVVTLSNGGAQAIQIGAIGILSGGVHFGQSNNCGATLAAGSSCSVQVRYTPSTAQAHGGALGVTVQGTLVGYITLAGSAVPRELLLSKKTLQFASTNVGQRSEILSVVVSNPTTLPATFSGMSIVNGAAAFAQSNNCSTGLGPGASCTVTVQFTPDTNGYSLGTFAIESSFGAQYVALSGQGTAPSGGIEEGPGAPPTSPVPPPSGGGTGPVDDGFTHYAINFLDTEVGNSSAVRNVKFTNKGDGPLKLLGLSIVAGETDFGQTNNCGGTLAPGAYCTLSLLFTPSALGARTGGIALLSDGGKFFFDLTGKGIGAVGAWRADSSADFGLVAVNSKASRSFTFANTGTVVARSVATTLEGDNLRITSNTCGTAAAPVAVAIGGTCTATVEYAPAAVGSLTSAALVSSGTLANGPVKLLLVGKAPAPALAFSATPSGDFGAVTVGMSNTRTFELRNAGLLPDTLAAGPTVTGAGFALAGGTCAAALSLPVNGTCTIVVKESANSPGKLTGRLTAASNQGAAVELALTANAVQSEYAITGAANSTAAPAADFGLLTAGTAATVVKYFYLRDNSNAAVVAASSIALQGDSSFTVTNVAVVNSADAVVSHCATSATGSTASCVAAGSGQSIRVGVKFAPNSSGTKMANLHFEHNGTQGVSDIQLTGKGVFDATGVWSSQWSSLTAPTDATKSFGTLAIATGTADKTFYVQNTGKYGGEAVGFTLSGDTSAFQIVSVIQVGWGGNGGYAGQQCFAGGLIAADKLSATPCLAQEPGWPSTSQVAVTVRFAPKVSGSHSIIVTPTTNNGTVLPGALTLTGTGLFDATGSWSTVWNGASAPTPSFLAYGSQAISTSTDKTIYARNTGTAGAAAVGFTLSGDVDHFQIVQVYRAGVGGNGGPASDYCRAGGVIAADKLSATPCLAQEPGWPSTMHVAVVVRFVPKAVGSYSLTVTPTTNNGTSLSGPITMTGTGR